MPLCLHTERDSRLRHWVLSQNKGTLIYYSPYYGDPGKPPFGFELLSTRIPKGNPNPEHYALRVWGLRFRV